MRQRGWGCKLWKQPLEKMEGEAAIINRLDPQHVGTFVTRLTFIWFIYYPFPTWKFINNFSYWHQITYNSASFHEHGIKFWIIAEEMFTQIKIFTTCSPKLSRIFFLRQPYPSQYSTICIISTYMRWMKYPIFQEKYVKKLPVHNRDG